MFVLIKVDIIGMTYDVCHYRVTLVSVEAETH